MIDTKLTNLVEKLKGKSVYNNLREIALGKCKDKVQETIGISSLLTHCLIECRTDPSYKPLVTTLFEKLSELLYEL